MRETTQAATLFDLLAQGAPARAAIQVPDGPTITYASLREQVATLASQLRSQGIRPGDRVAIVLPNGPEAIIAFLAAATAGTAAPLNQAYKADEFQFYLEDTKPKAIITPPQGAEVALSMAAPGTVRFIASLEAGGRVVFGGANSRARPNPGSGFAGADDVALVLHTSGTTSRPKRVPLRHRNIVASVSTIVRTYNLTPDDVSLCIMPLFHVHGLVASTLATLASGGTVLVPSRFNPLNFWPGVKKHRVTWYTAVPSMHQALVARARSGSSVDQSLRQSLRFIRSCSSPLSPGLMSEMEACFSVPVLEAYGMTEASHQMASNPLPPGRRVPGSVGVATGVEIAIMDAVGALLPGGAQGEVVIQGPNVISAYEDNPTANASSFVNGWFRTGDEGVISADGYLSLVGRIKELINRSGEKIAPLEIDEALLSHPAVAEAVAFGVPHATHGEEAAAAVVLSGQATEAELVKHCRERLADFKVPRTIYIVTQIPKTATGKIQRRLVAEAVVGKDPRI
ncbi:MAG: AMP-binding protein [Chloroflexi bacterium]|nr:AMP-binding protein [Chloroflexota bacterium]